MAPHAMMPTRASEAHPLKTLRKNQQYIRMALRSSHCSRGYYERALLSALARWACSLAPRRRWRWNGIPAIFARCCPWHFAWRPCAAPWCPGTGILASGALAGKALGVQSAHEEAYRIPRATSCALAAATAFPCRGGLVNHDGPPGAAGAAWRRGATLPAGSPARRSRA